MVLRKSFTKHIGMRIVDFVRKTNMCQIFDEICTMEFADISSLKELQFQKLKKLLIHCKKNVPYYQKLFSEFGFDPKKLSHIEDIQCLPILTKNDVRKNFSLLTADNYKKYNPKIRATGGSTGEPVKMLSTARSHGAQWAHLYRGFGFAGYKLGEKYATIAYGSLAPRRLDFQMYVYFWLLNTVTFPSFQIDKGAFEEIRRILNTKKPKYIYGYSSTIYEFAKYLAKKRSGIDYLKAVFTTSDMLYPEQREIIEKELNASVYDNYGCPEVCVMTNECSQHNGYHYNMESCYIEIVDKDKSGAGRIIATNFTNFAFPLIRYDTGDIGRFGKEKVCECKRSHTKIKSLYGRQRDVIILPNGRKVFGAFFNHFPAFYDNERINRYQIIQTDIDKLEIHLELSQGNKLSDFKYIENFLKETFNSEVSTSLIEGEFRESKISRKHRTVISDVDNIWTLND